MTKKEIGKLLKAVRGKTKLYAVCSKSGLTYQQLKKMEAGTSNYTIDSLNKLCGVLGIRISFN